MRNRSHLLLPVLLGILWFEGKAVASSMVLVAGDANIVNALDGTFGSPVDLGNQQFFTNLVQAGDEVVIQAPVDFPQTPLANTLQNFFVNEVGIDASIWTSSLGSADLDETDLLISVLPRSAFGPSDVTAARDLLNAGGSIFFLVRIRAGA